MFNTDGCPLFWEFKETTRLPFYNYVKTKCEKTKTRNNYERSARFLHQNAVANLQPVEHNQGHDAQIRDNSFPHKLRVG